jgi:hypothetical protein
MCYVASASRMIVCDDVKMMCREGTNFKVLMITSDDVNQDLLPLDQELNAELVECKVGMLTTKL